MFFLHTYFIKAIYTCNHGIEFSMLASILHICVFTRSEKAIRIVLEFSITKVRINLSEGGRKNATNKIMYIYK